MRMRSILASAIILSAVNAHGQASVTTNGHKYVLIEEETGAWCGYCPDGKTYLQQAMASSPYVISVSIHDANGNPTGYESMGITDGHTLVNTTGYLGVGSSAGYPSGMIDRTPGSDGGVGQNRGYWSTYVSTQLGVTPLFDVTLAQSYVASTRTVTITVTAKTLAAITGDYNINAYISEDSIASVGPDGVSGHWQHSYLYNQSGQPYYQKGTVITAGQVWGLTSPDYYHDGVLEAMLGGPWGTTSVIAHNAPSGGTYTKTYTYTVPSGVVLSHVKLTALVQKNNTSDPKDRAIANSIQAKLDTSSHATSVEQIASNINDVDVYPNPAVNNIIVKATVPANADAVISISNSIGQTVFSSNYKANGTQLSENISLANLSSGIYFVNIMGEGFKTTQKISINK